MDEFALSHVDADGVTRMVGVGDKAPTMRRARAHAVVELPPELDQILRSQGGVLAKGSVIETARLAGIMAAKRCSDLIPLCHPLIIDACEVELRHERQSIVIETMVAGHNRTGMEMEALTAATVAALTVYDMGKAVSHDIRITDVYLLEKTGGKRAFKRD